MNTVIKVGGREINIRALTWGEKKNLKEEGSNLSDLNPSEDNDALVEKIVELSVGDTSILDELKIYEVYEIFRDIISLSFVGEIKAKNSDGPQS